MNVFKNIRNFLTRHFGQKSAPPEILFPRGKYKSCPVTDFSFTEILPWPSVNSRADITSRIKKAERALHDTDIVFYTDKKISGVKLNIVLTSYGIGLQASPAHEPLQILPAQPVALHRFPSKDAYFLLHETNCALDAMENRGVIFANRAVARNALKDVLRLWNEETYRPIITVENSPIR